MLDRLLAGLDAIGCDRTEAFAVVVKVALDSVPALRLAVLRALQSGTLNTNELVDAVKHPAQTTRRTLEDLTAHGLVTYVRGGGPKDPHRWTLAPFAADSLVRFPETLVGAEESLISRSASSTTFRERTAGTQDSEMTLDVALADPSFIASLSELGEFVSEAA